MTNKVSFIFLAQDQYTAVAKQVAQATQAMNDKFAKMAGIAQGAGAEIVKLADKVVEAGKRVQQFGKSMSLYVSAPAAALAAFSIRSFDQQAVALAKVESAILSTGGAARLGVAELTAQAQELQSKTIFGDEKILNDVTVQLLKFTNIVGDQFKRTQRAALDMSTGTGRDLASVSLALGKALDNPTESLSALGRAGVKFTGETEELIKALHGIGMTAEAQNIILSETEKKFKGMAEAAAGAGLGPLRQLGNAIDDVREGIGKALLDIFNPLIIQVKGLAIWMAQLSPQTMKVIALILIFVSVLGPLIVALGVFLTILPFLVAGVSALGVAFAFLMSPIGLILLAFVLVAAAVIYMYSEFEIVREVIDAVALAIMATFTAVVEGVKSAWEFVSGIYDKMMAIKQAMSGAVSGAMDQVSEFMNFGGNIDVSAKSRTDVNVNLRAPAGAVGSMKARTTGNVPGMNVGVNMEEVWG